jgi:Na+/melibiose symporter-like transporter
MSAETHHESAGAGADHAGSGAESGHEAVSAEAHHATAPEDRISIPHKLAYGLGAFVNNTLAAAISGMAIVLNLGFGMSPALVGTLGALPRLVDALTDPLMGYISDNTRSKWGRRRPYIFVGAIAAGIVFALLWQLPRGQAESFYFWYFLGISLIFYIAYTIFATPWVALGYELTPDYHERTRLMGVQNFIGNIAYLVSPYFLWIMYLDMHADEVEGASRLAIVIGIVVIALGIVPAIVLRERFKSLGDDDSVDEGAGEASEESGPQAVPQLDASIDREYLETFAAADADYYIENWKPMLDGAQEDGDAKKRSLFDAFNWSAFLLSAAWLAYRKLWLLLAGFVAAVGTYEYIVFTAYYEPLTAAGLTGSKQFLFKTGFWSMHFVPPLLLGLFANRIYLGHAKRLFAGLAASAQDGTSAIKRIARHGGTIANDYPGVQGFFTGFATTLRFKPFRLLCIATFLVFNGFILISAFQAYVIIFYVFGGDKEAGSAYVGHSGLAQGLTALLVVIFVTWLARRIGKRRAFFVSTGVSMIGYASKWFLYTPDEPLLVLAPAVLFAFGLAGLFTLVPSMVADVVDADELNTHERREGMYGSIYWWVVKLGQSVAIFGGGLLLVATGFDVELGGDQTAETIRNMRLFDAFIPAVASGLAIWAVARFPITEEKAFEIRQKLEERRGKA